MLAYIISGPIHFTGNVDPSGYMITRQIMDPVITQDTQMPAAVSDYILSLPT